MEGGVFASIWRSVVSGSQACRTRGERENIEAPPCLTPGGDTGLVLLSIPTRARAPLISTPVSVSYLLKPSVYGHIMQNDPAGSGVSVVTNTPSHEAIGGHAIRATNLPAEVIAALDELQEHLGNAGRREAVAALLEFYHHRPRMVLNADPISGDGDSSLRARNVHKRHKKLLYDLVVELGDVPPREALLTLCGAYQQHAQQVVDRATAPHYR